MRTISSLAEGHVYALKYFPAELQALLNIASLRFHEWIPGHFASVLGWPKEFRKGFTPHSALLEHLEIHWGERERTVLLADTSTPSEAGVQSQTIIADTAQVLSKLQRGFEFAPPFSTVLTVVDEEYITLLSVFFRYCLLLQGHDTAMEGFQHGFWIWFEKLCRHVAKQTAATKSTQDTDASTSIDAEAKQEDFGNQVNTGQQTCEDKGTTTGTEEDAHVGKKRLDENVEKMRKEVEEWKMTYEEQRKKVENGKKSLRELHNGYLRFKARLEAREREMGTGEHTNGTSFRVPPSP
jgi:hypothetical protein